MEDNTELLYYNIDTPKIFTAHNALEKVNASDPSFGKFRMWVTLSA